MAEPRSESAVVVAVPARLASSRLPGKVMADVGGRPMLRHVLERCGKARGVAAVLACSDSAEVLTAVRRWGFEALATSEHCSSGSERLASVVAELVAAGGAPPERTLVINVQADQLLLDPVLLERMIAEASGAAAQARGAAAWLPVTTPVYPLVPEKIHDSNVVKVQRATDGRAITFSRSALPHVRDLPPEHWHSRATYWGHVGIYGYRADVLAGWRGLPPSPMERLEKLEQLRLIEAGIPIATFRLEADCFAVDTPAQLEQARALLGAEP
ncbi:MAG: manno-octulosonate cytidylyltransferase [Cyanobium sp. CZS 25K]|nr:manno-octulosonate cytidylyltransferase [Cyanobium sp. CZS25K]